MFEFDVIYEDNHILVAVKPADVPSQADSTGDPDFLSAVKKYLVEKYNKPGEAYAGLVHRLDRPASGVMVFAKTSKAASRLSEDMRGGELEKRYLAVLRGEPKNRRGRLEHYLLKDERKNSVSIVPSATTDAKYAALEYRTLAARGGASLVEINLLTGRSHQARVQMNSMGTPIYGDFRYGGRGSAEGANLALFSYSLRLTHPVKKQVMRFKAYPPLDRKPWNFFADDIKRALETETGE